MNTNLVAVSVAGREIDIETLLSITPEQASQLTKADLEDCIKAADASASDLWNSTVRSDQVKWRDDTLAKLAAVKGGLKALLAEKD